MQIIGGRSAVVSVFYARVPSRIAQEIEIRKTRRRKTATTVPIGN